jgi:hypothetical protein
MIRLIFIYNLNKKKYVRNCFKNLADTRVLMPVYAFNCEKGKMNFEKYILVYKKSIFYKYLPSTYVKCLIVFLGKVNPTGKTEEEDAGSPGQNL